MTTTKTFIVYWVDSTHEVKRYKSEGAAKNFAAKRNEIEKKNHGKNAFSLAVTDLDTYNTKVVHMVERINLMSGKTFMEPSNTPSYLSPASEAYWSA